MEKCCCFTFRGKYEKLKKYVAILLFSGFAVAATAQKGGQGSATATATDKVVNFFPNPAASTLNFEFKSAMPKGSSLQFFSFLGRKLNSVAVSGSRQVVQLSDDFTTGIYIFQLRDPNGRLVETNKFQVAR